MIMLCDALIMNCIIIPVATAIILGFRPSIVMGDNTIASSI